MSRRLIRKLGRDEQGATLVEFALLSVPLLGMIMGFGELGYMSYVKSNLQGSLNDVARSAVVEDPNFGGTGTLEQKIEAEVKSRMNPIVKSGTYVFEIQNFTDFAAIDKPEILTGDKNNNGRYDAGDCWLDSNPNRTFDTSAGRTGVGGADDVVVYKVTLTSRHLFPVMAVLTTSSNYSISATTLVRTQPYANQRQPEEVC